MRASVILSSASAVALCIGLAASDPALAADYPVLRGSQIEDTPPPPSDLGGGFNWTGFYLGGGAGVSDTKFTPNIEPMQALATYAYRNTLLGAALNSNALIDAPTTKRDSGAAYFGVAGYNIAFGDAVLGLELDYTRSDHAFNISRVVSGTTTLADGRHDWSLTTVQGAKLQDYATARLRMGWAYGRIMPFATIGGAIGRFNSTATILATDLVTAPGATTAVSATGYPLTVGGTKNNVYGFGLAAGLGIDVMLTENLFLRGEYQLVRFADVERTVTTVNTARVAAGLKF